MWHTQTVICTGGLILSTSRQCMPPRALKGSRVTLDTRVASCKGPTCLEVACTRLTRYVAEPKAATLVRGHERPASSCYSTSTRAAILSSFASAACQRQHRSSHLFVLCHVWQQRSTRTSATELPSIQTTSSSIVSIGWRAHAYGTAAGQVQRPLGLIRAN